MAKKYEIYHDESKEDAFWHIFLFVPIEAKSILLSFLRQMRTNMNINRRITFKSLSSQNSIYYASYLISFLMAAFQQTGKPTPFLFGHSFNDDHKNFQKDIVSFPHCLGLKVVILRQDAHHRDMNGLDSLKKIETTFRMGLQGGCHYLFDTANPIQIENIYLDGFDHYNIEHKRSLDTPFIKSLLITKSRSYLTFSEQFDILDSNNIEDRIIADLADIFLGSFRLGYLYHTGENITEKQKNKLATFNNIMPLLARLSKGSVRMSNSRFDRFGCFSGCGIKDGDWHFRSLVEDIIKTNNCQQESLF